jgi:hypothetical protein
MLSKLIWRRRVTTESTYLSGCPDITYILDQVGALFQMELLHLALQYIQYIQLKLALIG